MVRGVEHDGLVVIREVGGKVVGDGGEDLGQYPGMTGVASSAGAAGPARPCLAGQVQWPGVSRDGEPVQDGLAEGGLKALMGVQGPPALDRVEFV